MIWRVVHRLERHDGARGGLARRARALTGFALLLLAPCAGSAASAAQTHATATRHAPKLEDLPGIAGRLREALAGVPTSEVEEFARQVYFEAGCPRPQLAGVAWPALLADLGAILREVGIAPNVKAYLDLQEAYFVASTLGQRASALEIIQRALREAPAHAEDRADLAFLAANLESEEEHWSEMREYLQLAEEALPDAKPGSGIDLRVNAGWARLWIQFALPELARPRVEAELACARQLGTPWARSLARIDQLQLLNSEEDYEALDRMGDELFCEDWWSSASPQDQGSALLIVAAGWLTREHDELVPRGEAEWRLDQLRGAGRVSNDLRGWVLRHAASCAADGADGPRARALCAELACELRANEAPADYVPPGRLGSALIALEARLELAGSVGAPDRVERLRPHLERLHRSWDEFLAHWAQAPLRSGGLPYLFIAEHHQVIQELIELQIAVEGEEVGTRRGLVDLLQAQVLGTLSRRLQSASVTIEDVQRALCPEGAGVLLYFPSRDRSFVFAIDARGVRLFRLPPAHQLRQPCRALALAVQEAVHSHQGLDEPELRDAAAALARDVVPEDLARWIEGWSTVRVIGADDVGYLPFELLPAPNGGTRGARQAISYCASLPLAVALERAAAKPFAGGSRLVIAPDSDEPGMGLVIEAAEREALESMLPAPKVVSDGPRADTRALALAPGDSVALLHVLAHGRQDRTRERRTGCDSPTAWRGPRMSRLSPRRRSCCSRPAKRDARPCAAATVDAATSPRPSWSQVRATSCCPPAISSSRARCARRRWRCSTWPRASARPKRSARRVRNWPSAIRWRRCRRISCTWSARDRRGSRRAREPPAARAGSPPASCRPCSPASLPYCGSPCVVAARMARAAQSIDRAARSRIRGRTALPQGDDDEPGGVGGGGGRMMPPVVVEPAKTMCDSPISRSIWPVQDG